MTSKKKSTKTTSSKTSGGRTIGSLRDVFDYVKEQGYERPTPGGGEGSGYPTHFANAMARLIANALRPRFPEVKPDAAGRGTESPVQALRSMKKLDVNCSTSQAGLGLGVSLKSVHVRDKNPRLRFTHNMKRNDEELRAEAAGYHQRQPYSVLVAVVVLPFEACEDADERASSFGTWVEYLWPLAKRRDVHGDFDCFEAAFIALYDPETADLGFYDVAVPPPRTGRPAALLSLEEFAASLERLYKTRNSLDFRWADEVSPS